MSYCYGNPVLDGLRCAHGGGEGVDPAIRKATNDRVNGGGQGKEYVGRHALYVRVRVIPSGFSGRGEDHVALKDGAPPPPAISGALLVLVVLFSFMV